MRCVRFLALGLAAVLLVGCSSGEDSSEVKDPPEADGGSSAAKDSTKEVGSGGGSFCDRFNEFSESGVFSEEDPGSIDATISGMKELTDVAPPEIKEDMELSVTLVEKLAEMEISGSEGQSSDTTPDDAAKALDEASELNELMSDPKYMAAEANIEDYLVENCGFPAPTEDEQAEMDAEMEASKEALENLAGQGG